MALGGFEFLVQLLVEGRGHGVGFALRQRAFGHQPGGVELQGALMVLDDAVHQRLGEGRLVALVVPEPAIADHVEHHVLLELLAELDGDARGMDHGFGIIAIHMEDRRLHHQGDVGAIGRGAREHRRGGEADLVVDDEMKRAAGTEALDARHGKAFRHHALARERRVAMDQHGQHAGARINVVQLPLLGAGLAQHHGIDDFQMRRVGGQRQMDLVAVELAVAGSAQMIFDVAGAFDIRRIGRAALEFMEQLAIGLAHHIDQHVQAAAMGHAEHHFVHAKLAAALDDLFQRRDGGLAAVQAETLGADKAVGGEFLEAFRLDQLVEDGLLAFRREGDLVAGILDAALQPALLLGIVDVHEFIADAAAIDAAQLFDQLAGGGVGQAQDAVHIHRGVERGAFELVMPGIQRRLRGLGRDAQRIQLGFQMPDHAIGADHLDSVNGSLGGFGGVHGGGRCSGGRLAGLAGLGRRRGGLLSGQGRDQIAARIIGLGIALPGGAAAKLGGAEALFAQLGKIGLPTFLDRCGIGQPCLVHLLDKSGVGAVEEGRGLENVVRGAIQFVGRGLFSHFKRLWVSLLGSNPFLVRLGVWRFAWGGS